MDILIYIGLVVIIGIFFFLDKFVPTQNAMFVIIMISIIGFVLVQNTSITIIEPGQYELLNGTTLVYVPLATDVTDSGLGMLTVQSMFVLIYTFFLLLASINLFMGKKDSGQLKLD